MNEAIGYYIQSKPITEPAALAMTFSKIDPEVARRAENIPCLFGSMASMASLQWWKVGIGYPGEREAQKIYMGKIMHQI